MKIGIDLDNTITATPQFFELLTNLTEGKAEIHIITAREPGTEAEVDRELKYLGIRYDYIAITRKKQSYIMSKGIEVYFDDTDEYFQHLPESVNVFKIREPGNFCYETHRWFYGNKTGINVDEVFR